MAWPVIFSHDSTNLSRTFLVLSSCIGLPPSQWLDVRFWRQLGAIRAHATPRRPGPMPRRAGSRTTDHRCGPGLGKGELQQAVLAELEHLLFGLIALRRDGRHLPGGGILYLAFAQIHSLLEQLLLAFGLLEVGVFIEVDLGEAVQLLPLGPDFFFELVVLASFGLERIGDAAVFSGRIRGRSGSSRGLLAR